MATTTSTYYSPVPNVHRNYSNSLRIWPLYFLAFTEVFSSTLFGIALPNMLIFSGQISATLLGISSFINAIAFILGPILLRPLVRKLGVRRALITVSGISFLMVFSEVLFFHPILLIIFSVIDGLFTSTLFWATIESEISLWERMAPIQNKSVYFRRYGLSWNLGAIMAEVTGLLFTRFGFTDLFAMWIGVLGAIIQLPITFYITQRALHSSNNNSFVKDPKIISQKKTPTIQIQNTKHRSIIYSIPLVIGLFGEYIYQSVKTTFNFMYPFYLVESNNSSYWTYFAILGQQISQIIAINWMSRISSTKQYSVFMGSLLGTAGIIGITQFFPEQVMLMALIGLGITSGIIYSYSMQLILHTGRAEDSINNSTAYQAVSAIGFGFSPLVAGIMVESNMGMVFEFLFFSVLLCIISILAIKILPCINFTVRDLPYEEVQFQTIYRDYLMTPDYVKNNHPFIYNATNPTIYSLSPMYHRSFALSNVP